MDDFSCYLQNHSNVTLSKSDEAFQGSKEMIYQKKLADVQKSISNVVFALFVASFSLNAVLHWKSRDLVKMFEIGLAIAGVATLLYTLDMLTQFSGKGRSRGGARRSGKDSFSDKIPSVQLLILIAYQEFGLYINADSINGFLIWCYRLFFSLLIHMVYLDKYPIAKASVIIRILIRMLLVLFNIKYKTWYVTLVGVLSVCADHVCLINALRLFNKFLREQFSQRDNQTKFLNQMYLMHDSVPYPMIIFDPIKSEEDNSMQIVYFNLAGNELVRGMERYLEKTDIYQPVNFLHLIDPQDEGTLLDKIEMIRQAKSAYESMTTEIGKEIVQGPAKMRFDVTLWRLKWMERDVMMAMFNNDAYRPNKEETRFNSKFAEGLEGTLRKNTEIIETAIATLKKYKQGELDSKALYEGMSNSVADLLCGKMYTENLVLGEQWSNSHEMKIFSVKPMITNLVDIMSKNILLKGNGLRLEFTRSFPQHLIQARLALMRAFFYNLLQFIEVRLSKGNIFIQCDAQDTEDSDRNQVILKFIFRVEALRESDLPPNDFLNWAPGNTNYYANIKNMSLSSHLNSNFERKLMNWLLQIRDDLELEVKNYSQPATVNTEAM